MKGRSISRRRNGPTAIIIAAVVVLLALASASETVFSADEPRVRDVQAAYLRNFAKFVRWPDTSFDGEESPMVIGILGVDPFERALDQAVNGRKAHGRELQVRRLEVVDGKFPSTEQLAGCHLLFVSESERDRLPQIFERLEGTHVLTVSDLEGFATSGGIAEFFPVGPTIKFKFNRQAAERAGLRPSAQLLKLAIPAPSH